MVMSLWTSVNDWYQRISMQHWCPLSVNLCGNTFLLIGVYMDAPSLSMEIYSVIKFYNDIWKVTEFYSDLQCHRILGRDGGIFMCAVWGIRDASWHHVCVNLSDVLSHSEQRAIKNLIYWSKHSQVLWHMILKIDSAHNWGWQFLQPR